MLKKIFLLLFLSFLAILHSKDKNITMYSIIVNTNDIKSNGKSWDILGGAPDIKITIDGKALQFLPKCKNRYRCNINFQSTYNKWYFEIYDKDIVTDDIIGKGDCGVGQVCKLGLAKIEIRKVAQLTTNSSK